MISENSMLLVAFTILSVTISITFHEFMHGYASNRLGDDTAKLNGRLSINPIRHIDPYMTIMLPVILVLVGLPPFGVAKPVPVNFMRLKYDEFGGAIVGIAGPLSNLFLAGMGGLIVKLSGTMNSTIWVTWWWLFISVNVAFFIFNLIPFPPFDGSRVLFAFAPDILQNVMRQIEQLGVMAILLFMFVIFPLIRPILISLNTSFLSLFLG